MRTGKAHRAEHPLTHVIEGTPIEDAFATIRRQMSTRADTSALLANMLAGYSRAHQRLSARAVLRTYRRVDVLRRACSHLTDVELDTAWRAALRRDQVSVDRRVLPHVDARPRKPARKGSPWRAPNWITPSTTRR